MATREEVEKRVAAKLKDNLRKARFDPQAPIEQVLKDVLQAIRRADPQTQSRLVALWQKNQAEAAGAALNQIINQYLTVLAEQEAKRIPNPCIDVIDRIL